MDGKGNRKQRGKQLKRRRGRAGGKVREKKRKILALKPLFNRRRCFLATTKMTSLSFKIQAFIKRTLKSFFLLSSDAESGVLKLDVVNGCRILETLTHCTILMTVIM